MPLGAARITLLAFSPTVEAEAEVLRQKGVGVAQDNCQLSTAQSKFGGSSAVFDGTTDHFLAYFDNTRTDGEFTVEGWIRFDVLPQTFNFGVYYRMFLGGSQYLLMSSTDNTASGDINIAWNSTAGGGTTSYYDAIWTGQTWAIDTWYHVAFVRDGSDTYRVFLDGVEADTYPTPTNDTDFVRAGTHFGSPIRFGKFNDNRGSWDGYMDEIRVSDVCRYTSNFTPSTTPFVNDDNTLLLLHMDGTDASTLFEDDNGLRRKVGVTAIGNAQVDTAQSKYGGASLLLDGSGDYLQFDTDILNSLPGNDYTIELWARFDNTGSFRTLVANQGTNGAVFLNRNSSNKIDSFYIGTSSFETTSTVTSNTWYHIALVNDGGTQKLFLDGTLEASRTEPSYTANTNAGMIGRRQSVTSRDMDGYIDEVRISNTARYTDDFTPQEAPFTNDANTLLLLHMDGTDSDTDFQDDNGYHTPGRTAVHVDAGNTAQVDTAISKIGGSSLLLNNTSYLNTANPINIPTTGDFTVEMWVYFDATANFQAFFDTRPTSTQGNYITLFLETGELKFYTASARRIEEANPGGIVAQTWHHVALVRNGNDHKLYLDGTQVGSTYTAANTYIDNRVVLGHDAYFSLGTGTNSFVGNIDEVRVSNTARYTANFTPSTTAFTDDANTLLLLHMDGADASTVFTDDVGGRAPVGVSAVGNAQVDTAQSQFGGASALFDGTGDYLDTSLNNTPNGTNPYTIEGWIRRNVDSNTFEWYAQKGWADSTVANRSWFWGIDTSDKFTFIYAVGSSTVSKVSTTSIATGTWYHIAVSNDGTTTRLFVNGTSEASWTSASINSGSNYNVRLGADISGSTSFVNGHIDEFRISNTARYTEAFTPSTTPFQNDANTLLLLHMNGTDGSTVFLDDNGVHPG